MAGSGTPFSLSRRRSARKASRSSAPSFFWEDVFSMLVLALHTAYLVALLTGSLPVHEQMLLALSAYAAYVINAVQFLLKLRAARLDSAQRTAEPDGQAGMAT